MVAPLRRAADEPRDLHRHVAGRRGVARATAEDVGEVGLEIGGLPGRVEAWVLTAARGRVVHRGLDEGALLGADDEVPAQGAVPGTAPLQVGEVGALDLL